MYIFTLVIAHSLGWVVTDTVPPASPSDAAMAAIEATSLREAEIYFPSL